MSNPGMVELDGGVGFFSRLFEGRSKRYLTENNKVFENFDYCFFPYHSNFSVCHIIPD